MKSRNWCQVSNCKNKVYSHGRVCATHRWRMKNYNSYDLPNYAGNPNYLPDDKLPDGIFKLCSIHGECSKDQVYVRYYKGKENSYYCKECLLGINIKNKYEGMNDLSDYDTMLKNQNGLCGMCKTSKNNTTRSGKVKRFNIDHCHNSGKVRGLLCSFCNSLLGYAKDSIETLESAIRYLKLHKEQH